MEKKRGGLSGPQRVSLPLRWAPAARSRPCGLERPLGFLLLLFLLHTH